MNYCINQEKASDKVFLAISEKTCIFAPDFKEKSQGVVPHPFALSSSTAAQVD